MNKKKNLVNLLKSKKKKRFLRKLNMQMKIKSTVEINITLIIGVFFFFIVSYFFYLGIYFVCLPVSCEMSATENE